MKFDIIKFNEVASTNDIAAGDYPHGTVIVARYQTAGRGQRGNRWIGDPSQNLMFSLVVEPRHIQPDHQFLISIMAALASSDALRDAGLDCMVKWPNDLYVGDRKIGGILIEHSLMGEYLAKSVIGVGINVLQEKFDPSLPNPTSVVAETGRQGYTPDYLLEKFCDAFAVRYAQDAEKLRADYMARLWRGTGRYSFCETGTTSVNLPRPFTASVAGIDPYSGMLTLALEDGPEKNYWFKEIEWL